MLCRRGRRARRGPDARAKRASRVGRRPHPVARRPDSRPAHGRFSLRRQRDGAESRDGVL